QHLPRRRHAHAGRARRPQGPARQLPVAQRAPLPDARPGHRRSQEETRMSKRANPTLIGGFVIGAVVLLVAGVMLFGGGKLFQATQDFRLYFKENVNGLSVGAPVKFKGVEVGSVVSIQLVPNS